jgi:hypothetical protein
LEDATAEYTRRVNELAATGYDQAKFQVILDWYQQQQVNLNKQSTVSDDLVFPTGSF